MAFEEFLLKGRMTCREPIIRINKTGTLTFNALATKLYLQGAKFARLYYDKEGNRIGVLPTAEESESAYSFVKLPKTENKQLSLNAFYKYCEIDFRRMVKRNFKPFAESGLVVINLNEGV